MEGILPILLLGAALLACPVGMWLFGRFMMKGQGGGVTCSMGGQPQAQTREQADAPQEQVAAPAAAETVAALQAKVEALERELSRLRAAEVERNGQAEAQAMKL